MTERRKLTEQMRQAGIRRLLILSGDPEWCRRQAEEWASDLEGDWIWLEPLPVHSLSCSPRAIKTLPGREFLHAVFDASDGFHAEAFAALAGTLISGSWLLVLVPPWQMWSQHQDSDALRWNEKSEAIATPNFVHHFQRCVNEDAEVLVCRQPENPVLDKLSKSQWPDWQPTGVEQQQRILCELLAAPPGIHVLTAARGRGKSALAGMLANQWPGKCLVTAPAKASTTVLAQYAASAFYFCAPDALLNRPAPEDIDWLLIDEAAAIPAPVLQQLVCRYPRVLLTTTVQGYEGTGRGFIMKFCATLPDARYWQLDQPLRWSQNDPLEAWVSQLLIFDEPDEVISGGEFELCLLQQSDWQTDPSHLTRAYQLLTSAHYRTSPLDLRRMMDAQGMQFWVAANKQQQPGGALWLLEEGNLSANLAEAVWAGLRRPRGSLVAQSLAAHAGLVEAACLRSCRISRIAILPQYRRSGLGRRLVMQAIEAAKDLDFCSVSFGYTDELWSFWQACGFHLVRIGRQREASSGCYVAMAIRAVSHAGRMLITNAQRRLHRDRRYLPEDFATIVIQAQEESQPLNEDDWRELAGFAFAYRSFDTSYPSLSRLLAVSQIALPALRQQMNQPERRETAEGGHRVLLQRWRQEVRQALYALDSCRATQWQQFCQRLTNEHGRQ